MEARPGIEPSKTLGCNQPDSHSFLTRQNFRSHHEVTQNHNETCKKEIGASARIRTETYCVEDNRADPLNTTDANNNRTGGAGGS